MNQLVLPFRHTPDLGRRDFLWAASNETAQTWLSRPGEWPQHRLALWGEAGCGKSHLLHLWAGDLGGVVVSGERLPAEWSAPPAIAIDDADRCTDPIALLHLLNRGAEAGAAILLAGQDAPAWWPVTLPDLVSRLRAITAVRIAPPEDTLLRALLARLLSERQMKMSAEHQDWLRLRLPRTAQAMRQAADRLDHLGLTAGRKLDRRLAAEVVAELTGAACEDLMSVPDNSLPSDELG